MALNVLIVDDSPMMRNLVGRVLGLSGLQIGNRLDAGNGAEALKVMSENPVDLVLVDINMPVMNGEELVEEMGRKEKLRNLPVVVISTDGTLPRIERMKDLGVLGYLQKPFRPEELRDEVERVMQMRGISSEQLNSAVADAAGRVLETMCFSCVDEVNEKPFDAGCTPEGVTVSFAGTHNGTLQLWASTELAMSLAANFLGADETTNAAGASHPMLIELANMICGATLTALFPDGNFHLESPRQADAVPECKSGQVINLDEGTMWLTFEIRQSRWKVEAQFVC